VEGALRAELTSKVEECTSLRTQIESLLTKQEEAERVSTELTFNRQLLASRDARVLELGTLATETNERHASAALTQQQLISELKAEANRTQDESATHLQSLQDSLQAQQVRQAEQQSEASEALEKLQIDLLHSNDQLEAHRSKEDLQEMLRERLEVSAL
jgi:arginine deiminase